MRFLIYRRFQNFARSLQFYSTRNQTLNFQPFLNQKTTKMNLSDVVSQLNRLAPPTLAEDWDNVGLLVEPCAPHYVERILLTNDLTEGVLKEALDLKVNLIISYHPPIFTPMKKITNIDWKGRIVARCFENRIAIYSPHTSFDATSDGVNTWLAEAFDVADSLPIIPSLATTTPSGFSHKVEAFIPSAVASNPEVNKVLEKLEELMQNPESQNAMEVNFRSTELCPCILTVLCTEVKLPEIAAVLTSCGQLTKHTQIYKQDKLPLPGHGMGRICNLKNSISVNDAVRLVKQHLNLNYLRVANGANKHGESKVFKVAVCAGSGSSVLKGVKSDLYVTGEMSHHDVLDAVANGVTVFLCEHSNSERGFLSNLAPQLVELFERKIEVLISQIDKDPIVLM